MCGLNRPPEKSPCGLRTVRYLHCWKKTTKDIFWLKLPFVPSKFLLRCSLKTILMMPYSAVTCMALVLLRPMYRRAQGMFMKRKPMSSHDMKQSFYFLWATHMLVYRFNLWSNILTNRQYYPSPFHSPFFSCLSALSMTIPISDPNT